MFLRQRSMLICLVVWGSLSLLLTHSLWATDLTPQRVTLQQPQWATTPITVTPRPDAELVPTFIPVLFRDYRPQPPILGVALEGFNDESGLQETLTLGARWGRRWREVAWRAVEPNEGEFHWEVLAGLAEELLRARKVGVQPILEIQLTPEWAQQHKGHACGPIRADKFEAFAKFMEELVKRYGTATPYGVRYWQIANEMDVDRRIVGGDSLFGCWGEMEDEFYGGRHYGEMLKVVYPRIKAADANALVMMGGLLSDCDPYRMKPGVDCSNEERWRAGFFFEGVLKAGGGDYFDIADVHSYAELRLDLPARMHSYYNWSGPNGGTGLPEKVAFYRDVLGRYGHANKPIFAGEVALKCETDSVDCKDVGAAFIPRVYAEAYELGLIGATYYALISDFKHKGLLNNDKSIKPQYQAYEFMSSTLSHVEYGGAVTDYPGVSGQLFKRSGIRRIQVVWSTTGAEQTITLPADFVQAYDHYGNVLTPTDGTLKVSWAPIYVELLYQNQK